MYQNLTIFETASRMARHAGAQQAQTAENIANADTPGYRAKRTSSFSETFNEQHGQTLKATRAGHFGTAGTSFKGRTSISNAEPSPNGNAVSIEDEMMKSVQIAREHNRALTIYRHAMTVLRTSLGRA